MRVAVIPARGGSKRIPRKNIRLFAGKPVIAWSISAALESGLFDRVVVSTDDVEIADCAREFGAETPFVRPLELANDHAGTDAVVCHALRWLAESGTRAEHVCCIYATAPFVTADWLRKGWQSLVESGKEFSFSVTSYPFPIQRAIRLTESGGVEPFQPECVPMRSQDLEPAYHDAGQFYWGKASAYLSGMETFGPNSSPVILPRWLVQDIDTEEDWVRAEFMFQAAALAQRGGSR
jgi:N-acylneuraminate cytidylyltransferase